MRTAREWLEEADFDTVDPGLRKSFVSTVGFDKADEVQAAMKRIAENLLDALGDRRMSETTFLKLLRAVTAITLDNHFPKERSVDEA